MPQRIGWLTIQSALTMHINAIVEQILSYLVSIQDINQAHRDLALRSRSNSLRKSLTVFSAFLRSQQKQ